MSPGRRNVISVLVFSLFLSCGSLEKPIQETPLEIPETAPEAQVPKSGGIAEEIRALVENGRPNSLIEALELIRGRELGASEFGRTMNAVAISLMQNLYPDTRTLLPAFDPPQTHVYTRILREALRGNYTAPPSNSRDYLEFVLPFLAFLSETRAERLLSAMPDLIRARELSPSSTLAAYFLGLVYERSGRGEEARKAFTDVLAGADECYPAALGLARLSLREGDSGRALGILTELLTRFPDNTALKRQLAVTYYESRDWSRAEQAVAEILQKNPRDSQFILMRAHILVEENQFLQAQTPLDLYAAMDTTNRLYLFLRARVQMAAYKNRDAALNYLRSLLRAYPGDEEAAVYAAGLLMESARPEDQNEGRELMRRLSGAEHPSPRVVELALTDAIRREAWREAQGFLAPLLADRRSPEDLHNAYIVERGLGNNAAALSFARELYEKDSANDEGALAYISAMIDTGRRDDAARMIESRVNSAAGGPVKSKFYYLRSRLRTQEEDVMNELRQSLFEDPRNLDALIAMFGIYHRRRDERRAVYYLKQALAIAPAHPQLRRYQTEYAGLLGPGL